MTAAWWWWWWWWWWPRQQHDDGVENDLGCGFRDAGTSFSQNSVAATLVIRLLSLKVCEDGYYDCTACICWGERIRLHLDHHHHHQLDASGKRPWPKSIAAKVLISKPISGPQYKKLFISLKYLKIDQSKEITLMVINFMNVITH